MKMVEALDDLTDQQRIYVEQRLCGLSQVAAATAAGYADPRRKAYDVENTPRVVDALRKAREVTAKKVQYTREKAHEQLHEAYRNATTAAEQVMAVRELIKLHGVAAPEQVEVKHTHKHDHELRFMDDQQLLEIAGIDGFALEGVFEEVKDDDCQSQTTPPSTALLAAV